MKLKKIIPITAIALSILIGNTILGQSVYAAEKLEDKVQIESETQITEENLVEVLEYVGLNPNDFIKTDVKSQGIKGLKTVGELEDAIDKAKEPAEIDFNNKTTEISKISPRDGSKTLYSHLDCDSFTLTYSVSGQYSSYYKQWTGVSNADVSVDSDDLIFTYKVADDPYLDATYTARTITLTSYVTVNKYVGVGDYGLVPVGYQGVSGTDYFYASDYL